MLAQAALGEGGREGSEVATRGKAAAADFKPTYPHSHLNSNCIHSGEKMIGSQVQMRLISTLVPERCNSEPCINHQLCAGAKFGHFKFNFQL